MILGFTPVFVVLAIFTATVLDMRVREVGRIAVATVAFARAAWTRKLALLLLVVFLPLLVVAALHLIESATVVAWVPKELS